jgi:hypothetical protein
MVAAAQPRKSRGNHLWTNNFEVEIDGSISATKRFECNETIAGKYRSDIDGSRVPLMDRTVPWMGMQKCRESSLDTPMDMEDELNVIQDLALL